VRAGLAVWAFFARRPKLYHMVMGLQARLLGYFGRASGRFDALPFARGWTKHRDFPAPEGRTFQQLWADKRSGKAPR
jgi:L-lactate dehydrogenase complex protein LldF